MMTTMNKSLPELWNQLSFLTSVQKKFKSKTKSKHRVNNVKMPRFRCATLDYSDQTIWVAHWWRGATQNTWSGKRLSRTMVWAMVALRSDQMAKSHYSLIIGRTEVWTMVALRSDQRPKSEHKLPQNLTTEQ